MAGRKAFDVAIIGAGPAGSALALLLARSGASVVILERSAFDGPRFGESLAPDVQEPMRRLGLWDEFLALGPKPSWGTQTYWSGSALETHSHMMSPYGCGWHIDRLAFDQMLASQAVAAGAALRLGVRFRNCTYQETAWSIRATTLDAAPTTLSARLVVDASGRPASAARACGASHHRFDRLLALAMRWRGGQFEGENHLLVEAAPGGWWYTAPVPTPLDGRESHEIMIAMFMTDADLCSAERLHVGENWRRHLCEAPATRERLARSQPVDEAPIACLAHTQRTLRGDGDPRNPSWFAIGDAAFAVDPLSGSGVLRALRMSFSAFDLASAMIANSKEARAQLSEYEDARNRECSASLVERGYYYAAVSRFDTEFWRRRAPLRRHARWSALTRASDAVREGGLSNQVRQRPLE